MIAKSQENSREVARLLERAAAAAFGMETEDIVPHFDEIEVKCLSLVSSKGFETEIQRRVLEWKLRLLCDRNVSLSEIEKLHGPLRNLGYSNLENEANIELYLAQYCV